jgi:uncharacterized RDD family membrane protein YckC
VISGRPADSEDVATEPIADLPLFSPLEIEAAAASRSPAVRPAAPPAAWAGEQATLPIEPVATEPEPARSGDVGNRPATIGRRARAAALDALLLAAVLVVLLAGGLLLGAPADLEALPLYLPTWLLFSFLYHVVPLVFWGRTPGMARAGVTAGGASGRALSVGQAIRRWAGAMATLGLAGLPGLLALSGRSLADRFSHTSTWTHVRHAEV